MILQVIYQPQVTVKKFYNPYKPWVVFHPLNISKQPGTHLQSNRNLKIQPYAKKRLLASTVVASWKQNRFMGVVFGSKLLLRLEKRIGYQNMPQISDPSLPNTPEDAFRESNYRSSQGIWRILED